MTMRILCGLLAILLLAGCNENAANSVMPPPAALNSDAMGVFCGMNLMEHPGPKGRSSPQAGSIRSGSPRCGYRGLYADAGAAA